MNYLSLLVFVFFFVACKQNSNTSISQDIDTREEVLVYCENSMVPVLKELKDRFEEKFYCKIKLLNDCSQNLASLIEYTMEGDVFLPASVNAFKKLNTDSSKVQVIDSIFLGYNPLVIMSRKGNPSGFDGNLKSLAGRKHALIIANPETSSLGAETKKLLQQKKMYNNVILNVIALSTDSRGLVNSLNNEEAQLVINWASEFLSFNHSEIIDVFNIPIDEYEPIEIYGGILSTTENKELAKEFLEYAAGNEGLLVFKKYGFNRRKALIF